MSVNYDLKFESVYNYSHYISHTVLYVQEIQDSLLSSKYWGLFPRGKGSRT
jgi:hypothetical protein